MAHGTGTRGSVLFRLTAADGNKATGRAGGGRMYRPVCSSESGRGRRRPTTRVSQRGRSAAVTTTKGALRALPAQRRLMHAPALTQPTPSTSGTLSNSATGRSTEEQC